MYWFRVVCIIIYCILIFTWFTVVPSACNHCTSGGGLPWAVQSARPPELFENSSRCGGSCTNVGPCISKPPPHAVIKKIYLIKKRNILKNFFDDIWLKFMECWRWSRFVDDCCQLFRIELPRKKVVVVIITYEYLTIRSVLTFCLKLNCYLNRL